MLSRFGFVKRRHILSQQGASFLQAPWAGGIVLIVCVIIAMLLANLPATSEIYHHLLHMELGLYVDGELFPRGMNIEKIVNDGLMVVFFFTVGLEIRREISDGELSTPKKAILPVVAAMGGMIVPALIYAAFNAGTDVSNGWGIPMATDIAFSLGVLASFKTRVPLGLKVFLAALAVADDLGGIIVIALFYTSHIDMTFILLSAACVAVMVIANICKCRSKACYVTVGLVLWYAMLNSGIHSTIAGVLVAFCIPATLKKGTGHYLERIRDHVNKFPVIDIDERNNTIVLTHEEIHTLKSIESAADKMISPLQDLEDNLHFLINYIVIPLFAFANAGICVAGMSVGGVFSGVGLAVMLGLVLGKFVGVFSFSWIAVRLGFVKLPANTTWKAFASVCVICGIGFTVSMFIADLSYAALGADGAALLDQAKLGVLVGSVASALIGCVLLNFTLPKSE